MSEPKELTEREMKTASEYRLDFLAGADLNERIVDNMIVQAMLDTRNSCIRKFREEYSDAMKNGLDCNSAVDCGLDGISDLKIE